MAIPLQQLWEACEQGDLTAVQALARAGADVHACFELAFREACKYGHLHVAKWLVAQGGVNIHALYEDAVRRACGKGHLAVVQWLLSLGGMSAHLVNYLFIVACAYGHLALVQWLVAQGGVDIHARDNYAFSMACAGGHLAVGRWLVQQDPEYENWPAIEMACLKLWSEARAEWIRTVVGHGRDLYHPGVF